MKIASIVLISFLTSPAAPAQPIYKIVDADGNVIYTDQKPSDDAEPMELPGLNVLDGDTVPEPVLTPEPAAPPAEPQMTFEITSPVPGETVWTDGNNVMVQLDSSIDLPPGALVAVVVNGVAQQPVNGLAVRLDGLEPGEHRIHAVLRTAGGRVLSETEPVTFTLRQASGTYPEEQ
jgi:hypothetical protein